MCNKTIIRFGFCDIQNNQGLGKGCQPRPLASAGSLDLDLHYSRISQKPNLIIVYKWSYSMNTGAQRELP